MSIRWCSCRMELCLATLDPYLLAAPSLGPSLSVLPMDKHSQPHSLPPSLSLLLDARDQLWADLLANCL